VRWSISAPYIIVLSCSSLCQKLSHLVKVWQSYNKNNFDCFFETRCRNTVGVSPSDVTQCKAVVEIRLYDGRLRLLDFGGCTAAAANTSVWWRSTIGKAANHFEQLQRKRTSRRDFCELVTLGGDGWAASACGDESFALRPVEIRLEVLAHFDPASGERLNRDVDHSRVRHLHVDRRQEALRTRANLRPAINANRYTRDAVLEDWRLDFEDSLRTKKNRGPLATVEVRWDI